MIDLQGLFFVILIFALFLFCMIPIFVCRAIMRMFERKLEWEKMFVREAEA